MNSIALVSDPYERKPFPPVNAVGGSVDPRAHIEQGTGTAVFLAWAGIVVGLLLLTILTSGIVLVAVVVGLIVDFFSRKKAMALLKGSAVQLGTKQFPEIHRCAEEIARRLGMTTAPGIFLLEGNAINAAASRVAGKEVIILQDDLVDACLRSGDNRTLTFILAHEMAHHALGHTGIIRLNLARAFKKLARLDEFTCDAIANEVVGSLNVSVKSIALLATGPQLFPYLNLNALLEQSREVAVDKYSKKAERRLTHPLLLRRLSRFSNQHTHGLS